MTKNKGKQFEEDFKKSLPKDNVNYYYERYNDNASSFSGGNNTRFATHNKCDCELIHNLVFKIELKSTGSTSLPFSMIRDKQVLELSSIKHKNVYACFIFNFRKFNETYSIEASKVKDYMESSDRSSFPIGWCRENGINIVSNKLRVHYRYNLEMWINEVENRVR